MSRESSTSTGSVADLEKVKGEVLEHLWMILRSMAHVEATMDGAAGLTDRIRALCSSIVKLEALDNPLHSLRALAAYTRWVSNQPEGKNRDVIVKSVREYVEYVRDLYT